jgi:NosR/NirI family transcriptional regulator, nitrous oxide reductase regulator
MKKMTKTTKMKIYRTIIQILFLVFLPGLITLAFSQVKELTVNISNGDYNLIIPNCVVLIILSFLTIITGRIFCGWMCIFGSLNDWIYFVSNKLLKIKFKMNKSLDKYLKYLKYLILIAIAALVWTNILKLPSGSSPWDAYSQIFDFNYMLKEYLIGTFILLLIVIGAAFIERFFCRYLCPLGAIFAILSKFKIYKVHKEKSNCVPCKACTPKCSMGIDLDKVDVVNSGECIQCFNCVNICPKKNARVKVIGEEINEAAFATIAITTAVGVYSLSNVIVQQNLKNSVDTNIVQQNTSTTNNTTTSNTPAKTTTTTTTTTSNTPTKTATPVVTNTKYKDGTYTGTGRGYRPGVNVSVTIKNDKITSVVLVSTNDTPGYYERAAKTVPSEIVAAQSTTVKAVSGATRTSEGIIAAVEVALAKAKI